MLFVFILIFLSLEAMLGADTAPVCEPHSLKGVKKVHNKNRFKSINLLGAQNRISQPTAMLRSQKSRSLMAHAGTPLSQPSGCFLNTCSYSALPSMCSLTPPLQHKETKLYTQVSHPFHKCPGWLDRHQIIIFFVCPSASSPQHKHHQNLWCDFQTIERRHCLWYRVQAMAPHIQWALGTKKRQRQPGSLQSAAHSKTNPPPGSPCKPGGCSWGQDPLGNQATKGGGVSLPAVCAPGFKNK